MLWSYDRLSPSLESDCRVSSYGDEIVSEKIEKPKNYELEDLLFVDKAATQAVKENDGNLNNMGSSNLKIN